MKRRVGRKMTLTLTLSFSLSHSHSLSLFLSIPLSHYLTLTHSLSHFLTLIHSLSLSLSHYLSFTHSLSPCLIHSLSLSFYTFLVSPSPPASHPPFSLSLPHPLSLSYDTDTKLIACGKMDDRLMRHHQNTK